MALATRCPHCHSVFRVVADQLKLRGGLVRCGQCNTVFDAISALTYLDDAQLRQAAPTQAPPPPAPEVSREPDILLEAEPSDTGATALTAPPLPVPPLPERAALALRELADALASAPAPSHEAAGPAPSPEPLARQDESIETGPGGELAPESLETSEPIASLDSAQASEANELSEATAERAIDSGTTPIESVEAIAHLEPQAASPETEPGDAQLSEVLLDPAETALADSPSAAPVESLAETEHEPRPSVAEAQAETTLETPAVPALLAAQDAMGSTLAEPEFLRRAAQEEARRRSSRWWAAGCAVLALVLVGQLLLAFRAQVLTRWPQAYPLLVEACAPLGCSVSWPAAPDQLAVLASDLQALPGTSALELNVSLRNRAPFPQSLPALEITLTDTRGQALIRKVVLPADYLPAQHADRLAAGEDLAARIFLEVQGQAPAGFLVYPFHP